MRDDYYFIVGKRAHFFLNIPLTAGANIPIVALTRAPQLQQVVRCFSRSLSAALFPVLQRVQSLSAYPESGKQCANRKSLDSLLKAMTTKVKHTSCSIKSESRLLVMYVCF